jgi:DNA-binding transcriptional LysR family regulator
MLGGRGSSLHIGASVGPAYMLLPGALKRFRAQHPGVPVNLESGIYDLRAAKLRSGGMDMAISPVPHEGVGPGLTSEPLYRNDSVVMAHPQHPLRATRHLADLVEADWLLTGQGMKGPGSAILEAFEAQGLPSPRVALRCDNIGMAQMLLLDNPSLLCLLPRKLLTSPPLDRFLIALPIEEPLPSHMVSLIYPSDLPMTPVAADFATLLRREAHYLVSGHDRPA